MMYFEVNNLCIEYPGRKFVYDFACDKGEIIGLFGPSGAGKTTFFRGIAGLEPVSDANSSVILDGKDITKLPVRRRKVGYVMQDYAIFENLSVEKNLRFVLFANHVRHSEWNDRIRTSLESVRLLPLARHASSTLSGGEKQRLAIARSCIVLPKLMLLDEPFNSMDNEVKSCVIDMLLELNGKSGLTMIIVSHNFKELSGIATRLVPVDEIKMPVT